MCLIFLSTEYNKLHCQNSIYKMFATKKKTYKKHDFPSFFANRKDVNKIYHYKCILGVNKKKNI